MIKVILVLLAFVSLNSWARMQRGTIHKIDYGKPDLLLMNDGSVLKVSPKDKDMLKFYEEAIAEGDVLLFEVDKNRVIQSTEAVDSIEEVNTNARKFEKYLPTVLTSSSEVRKIFNSFRRDWSSSGQCYNRAHVWSYEAKNQFKHDSMKVFTFYTRKYIRKYNFEWWFHVAPFTYLKEGDMITEKVLDPRFAREPLSVKPWTDIFMRNKAICPVISKYSDYENHQEKEWCYLYKASMYYVQPLDLDNLERTGTTKTKFLNWEVKRAYRNGFGWW